MRHHELDPPCPVERSQLSLPPHVVKLPFWVDSTSLGSLAPQLLDLPFVLPGFNVPQLGAADEPIPLSSTIVTPMDIEDAAATVPQATTTQRCRRPPVRNFSLPTYQAEKTRSTTRYYSTALSEDDRKALARGEMNHNFKPWTRKNLILAEDLHQDLRPTNTYFGPDKQVCIIPDIIVTQGESQWTHIKKLRHQYYAPRSSNAPSTQPTRPGPIAQSRARMYARTASNGGYSSNIPHLASYHPLGHHSIPVSRARSPLLNEVGSHRPSEHITFDTFMAPHRSGKGEVYQDKSAESRGSKSEK